MMAMVRGEHGGRLLFGAMPIVMVYTAQLTTKRFKLFMGVEEKAGEVGK